MIERHTTVAKQARWYLLGEPGPGTRELWIALHGYGQLGARFARHFEAIASGERVVVVPEALNKFYLEPVSQRPPGGGTVGATWMTREDRERDIEDYVAYLDRVVAEVDAECGSAPAITVLGFSQGAATASRWAATGSRAASRVVLWGGLMAPDVIARGATAMRGAALQLVVGTSDEFATPKVVAAESGRLKEAGIAFTLRQFEGGHAMHPETLAAIAASSP
ncbi:MAG: Esterase/lipase [Gemmatimonadetes bacterium]|nr:Esterase/lipase [Gemmatimonadota bacterium]